MVYPPTERFLLWPQNITKLVSNVCIIISVRAVYEKPSKELNAKTASI